MSTALSQGSLGEAIIGHVRAHIKANAREFAKTDVWHMSATGSCFRKRIIERAGLPQRDSRPESLMVFEYGHKIESILRAALRTSPDYTFISHGRVYDPDLGVAGTFDLLGIPKVPGDLPVIMLDVKSASGKSFDFAKSRPRENYRGQLAGYARNVELRGFRTSDLAEGPEGLPVPQVTDHPPIKVDAVAILYQDKEYGELYLDVFNKEEWGVFYVSDWTRANALQEDYKRDGTLPPEVPFEAASRWSKQVKEGRAKAGDMVPHALCSPLYCRAIEHCPAVKAWWERTGFDFGKQGELPISNGQTKGA